MVNEVSTLLKSAQLLSLNQPTTYHFQEERLLQEKLNFLRRIEEEYFKQKSRINWLLTGDQNTTYFHMMAKAKIAYNTIHTLAGLDDTVVTSAVGIGNLAVSHFKGILGPWINRQSNNSIDVIAALTKVTCSPLDMTLLSKPPAADEIISTLFKLNPNKSPGPDGLASGFYKAAWSCIGDEVLIAINSFFINPIKPIATNSTILTPFRNSLVLL